jgi:hypothetical protein
MFNSSMKYAIVPAMKGWSLSDPAKGAVQLMTPAFVKL